jgi:hypothetical protein
MRKGWTAAREIAGEVRRPASLPAGDEEAKKLAARLDRAEANPPSPQEAQQKQDEEAKAKDLLVQGSPRPAPKP